MSEIWIIISRIKIFSTIIMTEEQTYKQVLNKIDWILEIAKRKNWNIITMPFVDEPATIEEINAVEKQIGKTIPLDFKKLFLFSRHVDFGYSFDETLSEEFREEFKDNFAGEIYWNLNTLVEQYVRFQGWVGLYLDPQYNDPDEIELAEKTWFDKLPIIDVTNGDTILVGNNPSEVVYFSHEMDEMHGKILGENLWAFLDFYSRIGFAGSECWQLEPFFDYDNDVMITHGSKVDRYIELLEK